MKIKDAYRTNETSKVDSSSIFQELDRVYEAEESIESQESDRENVTEESAFQESDRENVAEEKPAGIQLKSERENSFEEWDEAEDDKDWELHVESDDSDYTPRKRKSTKKTKSRGRPRKQGASEKPMKDLKCDHCGRIFNRQDNLTRHIQVHLNERKYECSTCGKRFNTNGHLWSHKKIHELLPAANILQLTAPTTNEQVRVKDEVLEDQREPGVAVSSQDNGVTNETSTTLQVKMESKELPDLATLAADRNLMCRICGRAFRRRNNLKNHIAIHLNQKRFKCLICGKGFNTSGLLCYHKKHSHGPGNPAKREKIYPCKFCGKKFSKQYYVSVHIKGHLNKKEYKCTLCGKEFNARANLKVHLISHQSERNHTCEYCGKGFKRRDQMRVHVRCCLNMRTYQCTECEKRFNSSTALVSHTAVHRSGKDFTCEYCGKAFKRLGGMKNHMKIHLNEKAYKCSVCGKGHNTSSLLAMHLKVHSTAKNYSCEKCGKVFKWRHSLRNHIKGHNDEKHYQCKVCGKEFNLNSTLCSHRKYCRNDGEECPVCHEVINGGRRMFKNHMKLHPVEHPCEFCGKIFKRKEHWKRHIACHLNERRYQCALCDKAFNTSSQRSTHRARVHKENTSDLSVPNQSSQREPDLSVPNIQQNQSSQREPDLSVPNIQQNQSSQREPDLSVPNMQQNQRSQGEHFECSEHTTEPEFTNSTLQT